MDFADQIKLRTLPGIDIVMPTLNSEATLESCLKSIKNQIYSGRLNVIIVDGGSEDRTVEIARRYNCTVYIQRGMYMNGTNGAYNFGIKHSNSDFIFIMDSDHILVGTNFFSKLIEPLIFDSSINLSVSVPVNSPHPACIERFSIMKTTSIFQEMTKRGKKSGDFYIVDDLSYGLTNCVLSRRSDYLSIGVYVSDVSFLVALRSKKLARASINFNVNSYSPSLSYVEVLKKMYRRYKKVASIIQDYEITYSGKISENLNTDLSAMGIFKNAILTVYEFLRERDMPHFCGMMSAFMPFLLVLIRPISSLKVYLKYLKKMFPN